MRIFFSFSYSSLVGICLYACLFWLWTACSQAPDQSFTKQIWQASDTEQSFLALGDVLIFEGDSVRIRNKFTGLSRQIAWFTSPLPEATDSLAYLVAEADSEHSLQLSVYGSDSLLVHIDRLVPAAARDTSTQHCLEADATYAADIYGQRFHLVTVALPGETQVSHLFAIDTVFDLQAQDAATYSMDMLPRIDEAGIFQINFFNRKSEKGTALLDFSCQCIEDDGKGQLQMQCLVKPFRRSLDQQQKNSLDTFYFQQLPPLIPLEVGEGTILERINTGWIVIEENIGSIGPNEASYDDEETFANRKGLYYHELQDLNFDMAPNGLFTLFTSQKVIIEKQWQLSEDRRHIILHSQNPKRINRIAITAYNEEYIELGISGLRVTTPKNFGEQLMSYVMANIKLRIFVE